MCSRVAAGVQGILHLEFMDLNMWLRPAMPQKLLVAIITLLLHQGLQASRCVCVCVSFSTS